MVVKMSKSSLLRRFTGILRIEQSSKAFKRISFCGFCAFCVSFLSIREIRAIRGRLSSLSVLSVWDFFTFPALYLHISKKSTTFAPENKKPTLCLRKKEAKKSHGCNRWQPIMRRKKVKSRHGRSLLQSAHKEALLFMIELSCTDYAIHDWHKYLYLHCERFWFTG